MLLGKLNGLLGTSRQSLLNGKDHCAVRIPGIPFRPLVVFGAGRLLQCVPGINWTILGQSAIGTPATVLDSMLDGPVQRGPVSASLPSGKEFRNHGNCLHRALVSVQSEPNGSAFSFLFRRCFCFAPPEILGNL